MKKKEERNGFMACVSTKEKKEQRKMETGAAILTYKFANKDAHRANPGQQTQPLVAGLGYMDRLCKQRFRV